MRIYRSVLAVIGSLGLASLGSAAYAGGCGYGAGASKNCAPSVVVNGGQAGAFDPMTVNVYQPMGHLRSVHFNRAPNVSITRVHAMGPTAALDDAPSRFTKGCHPKSTHYCRSNAGVPVNVEMSAPIAHPPLVMRPTVQRPPVMVAPIPAPRLVWQGQGYDPSKFQPRQYGTNDFTPGIAHVPTSYVERSPAAANMALHSGRAVPQRIATGGGIAPGLNGVHVSVPHASHSYGGVTLPGGHRNFAAPMGSVTLPGGYMGGQAPMMPAPVMQAPVMSAPVLAPTPYATAPVETSNGLYASNVAPDGTYWEKTSGPKFFGDTLATQVICKRQLPQKVVNPVVGVPEPVCVTAQPHAPHKARHVRKHHGPVLAGGPDPRWSY